MVWERFGLDAIKAIQPWVLSWIRGSLLDRLIYFVPLAWMASWAVGIFLMLVTDTWESLFVLWFIAGTAIWAMLPLDYWRERSSVKATLEKLYNRPGVVLATRAEYLGGHPELPHNRFVFLTIDGYRENPQLTIMAPQGESPDYNRFQMPLLDFESADEKRDRITTTGDMLTASLLATLSQRPPRLLGSDRLTMNVRYLDAAGQKQTVELTNFWHGSGEIRNWRNFLVCTQAEATTGITPFGPWKSLPAQPHYDGGIGGQDWDERERPAGSAFRRR